MRTQRIEIGAPAPAPRLMEPGLASNLSYMAALEAAGVERDERGNLVHWLAAGERQRSDGSAVPVLKRFPVALSLEEAREKTRATGDRHDYYALGLDCRECRGPLRGWVLGGRKIQNEHDHVTFATPELYREVEPDDAQAADTPVAVGV